MPRVVIIGAGPSGIAAATRLIEAGFENTVILEGENRIGGRIHTVPFGDNFIDLGAQWCHGEKRNVIFELVKDLDVLESTGTIYEDFKCIRSNKEIVPNAQADILKSIAFNLITERQEELSNYEGSLGAYLTEKYWCDLKKSPEIDQNIAEEFLEFFKKFESSIEASDNLFEVSGKGHLEYWLCEGDLLLNWRDKGFKTFLKLLMKAGDKEQTREDLGTLNGRIFLNKRVEHINWNSGDEQKPIAVIKCFNGELFEADHVICTVSLGVLKENYKEMFTPPLPIDKCRAIEGLKLGTVDKFFLEFEHNFWPSDWTGIAFLWRQEDLRELRESEYFWLETVFGFYTVPHQLRLLEGWAIGPNARYMETLTEAEVKKGLLWMFKKFLDFPIPEPIGFIRSQWYANPNFRGSYTFRSMLTDELRTGAWHLASPLTNGGGKPILQFAGESTHTHFYSTVHGAVESGWREARRLIEFYEQRPSKL